jgi:hypothetical protein
MSCLKENKAASNGQRLSLYRLNTLAAGAFIFNNPRHA